MGDVPPDKLNPSQGTGEGITSVSEPNTAAKATNVSGTGSNTQHARPPYVNHHSSPTAFMSQGAYGLPSPLNMSNMAYSLASSHSQPLPFEPHLVHQYPAPAHAQGLVYPIQSMGHYPGHTPEGGIPYGVPFASPYAPYPMPQQLTASQHSGGHYPPYIANPPIQSIGGRQAPVYGASYYHSPSHTPFEPRIHLPTGHKQQPGFLADQGSRAPPPVIPGSSKRGEKKPTGAEYDVAKTIVDGSNPAKLTQPTLHAPDSAPIALSASTASAPRGPPRKPKQSGHALWVGNLPPGANVMDLKDHFSRDATNDIESVFLISKSNCAFVNYRSASACTAALARFHDSRFQGVRLVCRLRKGFTAPGSGSTMTAAASRLRSEEGTNSPVHELPAVAEVNPTEAANEGTRPLDRYFVVKSLTVEDLELSKQSGIWATQTHNETNLNHAFETTDNVYLIFSANKSGEYFGYARMLSPINDDEELALEMPPRPDPLPGGADELDVTPTMATSMAPKGRIIDDSARGTIFWEVESSEDEQDDGRSERSFDGPPDEPELESQTFGKPFRIQWLSTERVPFHRTRGLRNPWNANREVKIARDGTEIEPMVGRQLLQLFHLP